MARGAIVDGAVIFIKVIETASGVDGTRIIKKSQRVTDMAEQKIAAKKKPARVMS